MSIPAGWYDDGHGQQRWWDGQTWTEQVQAPAQPPAPTSGSKKWILWVVIGVVALMIIGGALFFIVSSLVSQVADRMPVTQPVPAHSETAVGTLPTGAPTPPAEVADATELTDAERAAAEDVIQRYDVAWSTGNCDEFFALTTDDFRGVLGIEDCAAFAENSASFGASVTDYAVTVTGAYRTGEWTLVETTESGMMLVDDTGAPLAEPEPFEEPYFYELLDVDGALKIDYIS